MATSSTEKKVQRIAPRQRIATSDLEIISELALDLDSEDHFAIHTVDNVAIEGWQVVHVAGREFSVGPGKGIVAGELLKDAVSFSLGEQDAIVDPTHDRYDVVYIDPANYGLNSTTDNASKVVMSAVTMTSVAAEAVGTGDTTQKSWDLDHSGVDPSTLLVYVNGSQEHGGYDFSKGTGAAGVDQIIFATAPGAVAITADYDYLTGGVEASASVATRYTKNGYAQVVKGTEAVSASVPSVPAGSLRLAVIHYGTGWATGAPTSIDNTVKEFLITHDNLAEPTGTTHTPNKTAAGYWAGKIAHPLRKIHGIVEGFRLQWLSSTIISVSPGFAICEGVACRSSIDVGFTPTFGVDITGVGWYYAYIEVQPTNTTRPGSAPVLRVYSTPPDSLARKVSATGSLYVGCFYNTGAGAVAIRGFHYHGNWCYYRDTPTSVAVSTGGASPQPLTVTDWVPPTGRLMQVETSIGLTGTTVAAETAEVIWGSHKDTTSLPFPRIFQYIELPSAANFTQQLYGQLRAEDTAGVRQVHATHAWSTAAGTKNASLKVLGFLDDYRTMDTSGSPVFY